MQQNLITKDRWVELFDILNPLQHKIVAGVINSLLRVGKRRSKRDKSSLLNLSVWTDNDIQEVENAQQQINEWQIRHQ